jgi:hypothetical protein
VETAACKGGLSLVKMLQTIRPRHIATGSAESEWASGKKEPKSVFSFLFFLTKKNPLDDVAELQ